jgi:hypothetical protein
MMEHCFSWIMPVFTCSGIMETTLLEHALLHILISHGTKHILGRRPSPYVVLPSWGTAFLESYPSSRVVPAEGTLNYLIYALLLMLL